MKKRRTELSCLNLLLCLLVIFIHASSEPVGRLLRDSWQYFVVMVPWRLAAFVVPVEEGALTEEDVLAYCKEHVSRHAVPREVHFLDELPRNATGKIVARVLRDRFTT